MAPTATLSPVAPSADEHEEQTAGDADFGGSVVASFETRKQDAMEAKIREHSGVPRMAPTVRAELMEPGPGAIQFATHLRDGRLDALLFLTPAGVTPFFDFMKPVMPEAELRAGLADIILGSRGPKTTRALRDLGLHPTIESRAPHTWRELVQSLEAALPAAGATVAVVEHGVLHLALRNALMELGAEPIELSLYRWVLPENVEPLKQLLQDPGSVGVFLFTNGAQADAVFSVAEELGQREALMTALQAGVVAAIGPVTADRLSAFGVRANVIAEEGTMDSLIKTSARALHGPGLFAVGDSNKGPFARQAEPESSVGTANNDEAGEP